MICKSLLAVCYSFLHISQFYILKYIQTKQLNVYTHHDDLPSWYLVSLTQKMEEPMPQFRTILQFSPYKLTNSMISFLIFSHLIFFPRLLFSSVACSIAMFSCQENLRKMYILEKNKSSKLHYNNCSDA